MPFLVVMPPVTAVHYSSAALTHETKSFNCNFSKLLLQRRTAVAQWLRCRATNRKVAGSIPAGVSGFFIDIKSFRSHYGPGVDSTSNRNEYQEYFLEVKGGLCVRLKTYHLPVLLSRNLGTLTSWKPLGPPSGSVTGRLFTATALCEDATFATNSPFLPCHAPITCYLTDFYMGRVATFFKLTDPFLKPTKITEHAYLAIFLR